MSADNEFITEILKKLEKKSDDRFWGLRDKVEDAKVLAVWDTCVFFFPSATKTKNTSIDKNEDVI
jgi:hypothetical protein